MKWRRVRDFLEGRITYDQLWSFLRLQGARVPFDYAKRVLERIGVRAGAFVYKTDDSKPLRLLPAYPQGYKYFRPFRDVFYVRAVCQSPFFGGAALLLENSFPFSVQEALCRGLAYRGNSRSGVFYFFAPRSFRIVKYVDPALVHLALITGQYTSLISEEELR